MPFLYNTNEIPGELSSENLVSSHVKIYISPWLHNKSRLSHQVLLRHCCFSLLTEEDYPQQSHQCNVAHIHRANLCLLYELYTDFIRATQREYSSKPLKHSIVKRILVFKRQIQAYFHPLKMFHLFGFPSVKSSDPKILGINYLFENFSQKKGFRKFQVTLLG